MVPAKLNDSIEDFLYSVQRTYAIKSAGLLITINRLLVEDAYEVDSLFTVGDCFTDLIKVKVQA